MSKNSTEWITWIEKERAIKEARQAILKSKKAMLPIHGFTFPDLNRIWVVQKRLIRALNEQKKTKRSLDTINNTIFNVYLWILQFINFIPFISLGIIGYDVITNFSMWNLFIGILWQIGIVASAKIFTWLLILIVGYGFEKVETKNNDLAGYTLLEMEKTTHEITPQSGLIYCYSNEKFLMGRSIKRMYEESQKGREDQILTFEEKVLKLVEVHAPESKIVNSKFLQEMQMVKRLSNKRNLDTEKYLELITDLANTSIEEKHYKLIFDTNSLKLKAN